MRQQTSNCHIEYKYENADHSRGNPARRLPPADGHLVAAATHLRCASVSVGCRGNLSPLRSGSQNALGRALGVSPRSINEIVLGRRAITPEMSLKLGKFFKQSPQFWFNIQTNCDFRRIMKQANRITAKVKGDFTKLAA